MPALLQKWTRLRIYCDSGYNHLLKELLPLLFSQLFTVIHTQCFEVIIPERVAFKYFPKSPLTPYTTCVMEMQGSKERPVHRAVCNAIDHRTKHRTSASLINAQHAWRAFAYLIISGETHSVQNVLSAIPLAHLRRAWNSQYSSHWKEWCP